MPSKIELRVVRAWARTIAAVALALPALALSGCEEDPQSGPDASPSSTDAAHDHSTGPDGAAAGDGGQGPDGAAAGDGGQEPPILDAGGNDAAVPPDGAVDPVDVRSDGGTAGDAHNLDVVRDSAAPGDGGIADAALDAVIGAVDADAGTMPPTPIFSECTYAASFGGVPSAIIDATEDQPPQIAPCSCTYMTSVTINRVLCGSFLPWMFLYLSDCISGPGSPSGQRNVMILESDPCTHFPQPLEGGLFFHTEQSLANWDALLAEQIVGHADAGRDASPNAEGGSGDAGVEGGVNDGSLDGDAPDGGTADGGIQDGASDG